MGTLRCAFALVGTLLCACACGTGTDPLGFNEDGLAQAFDLPQAVVIDVISTDASSDIRLNGGLFPDSSLEQGLIYLQDPAGYQTLLGLTDAIPQVLSLVAGTYDAKYLRTNGGQTVPTNLNAMVAPDLALTGNSMVTAYIQTVAIRPTFTLGGRAFPLNVGEVAQFLLRRAGDRNEFVPLGTSEAPIESVTLIPGTYDVVYQFVSGGTVVPINAERVVMSGVLLDEDGDLEIDVTAVLFETSFQLAGGSFPESEYEQARFWLVDGETGSRTELGSSNAGAVLNPVIPGTYDIDYERLLGGEIPRNVDVRVKRDVVVTTQNVFQIAVIDVPMVMITPVFQLNGEDFPINQYEQGGIYLRSKDRPGEEIYLGSTETPPTSPCRIVPGTYDVYWQRVLGGAVVPRNASALVMEDVVLNADGDLIVDVQTVDVVPQATLNGEPFPASQYEYGRLYLRTAGGDEVYLGETPDGFGTRKIVPGTYDVVYERVLGGDTAPINNVRVVMQNVALTADGPLAIDVQARRVRFDFRLDGLPFPMGPTAQLYLRDPVTGGENPIGTSGNPEWWVILGTYDVVYRHQSGAGIPQNPFAVAGQVTVVPEED